MKVVIFAIVAAWAVSAYATIRFVPDDFTGLQQALDESGAGDTIVCRAGVYHGPYFIWARSITLASEFIFSGNPGDISNCTIRPSRNSPENRCLFTQEADSTDTILRLIGLTFANGRVIADSADNQGGAILLRDRSADIQNCIFKSCRARYGGAIFVDRSSLVMTRCSFLNNDASQGGRMIYVKRSDVVMVECDLGPMGDFDNDQAAAAELYLNACSIDMIGCRIHDIGTALALQDVFRDFGVPPPRNVRIFGCLIENNTIGSLYSADHPTGCEFVMDSCTIRNNLFGNGFIRGWAFEGMESITITRNWFENNREAPETGAGGLLNFNGVRSPFFIEENTFLWNDDPNWACVSLRGSRDPHFGRVQRNIFFENRSGGYPFDVSMTVLLDRVGQGVLEYNDFSENIGAAVYSTDLFGPESFAMHNFWGDSSGPYELTRNPIGMGDTTNAWTIYEDWLRSAEDIPDTSIFPDAVDEPQPEMPAQWSIVSAYPNPFNGEFVLEFDRPVRAPLSVDLFDILGRRVSRLVEDDWVGSTLHVSAPGHLASGAYFVRVFDTQQSQVIKTIHLK